MSCTAQPVFQVKVNEQVTHLCGKCMTEHYDDVIMLNEHPVIGETCQCIECKKRS